MHAVIAWWDDAATTGAACGTLAGAALRDYPGLLNSRPISDPGRNRHGLALLWEDAADADLLMPQLAREAYGCDPAHRWSFDLVDPPKRQKTSQRAPEIPHAAMPRI